MKTAIASMLGTWVAWGLVAAWLSKQKPRTLPIRCAWCGEAAPASLIENGVDLGRTNRYMREHAMSCRNHPLYAARRDLARVYSFASAARSCLDAKADPLAETGAKQSLAEVMSIAGSWVGEAMR